jgi:hypothetical protein
MPLSLLRDDAAATAASRARRGRTRARSRRWSGAAFTECGELGRTPELLGR